MQLDVCRTSLQLKIQPPPTTKTGKSQWKLFALQWVNECSSSGLAREFYGSWTNFLHKLFICVMYDPSTGIVLLKEVFWKVGRRTQTSPAASHDATLEGRRIVLKLLGWFVCSTGGWMLLLLTRCWGSILLHSSWLLDIESVVSELVSLVWVCSSSWFCLLNSF